MHMDIFVELDRIPHIHINAGFFWYIDWIPHIHINAGFI